MASTIHVRARRRKPESIPPSAAGKLALFDSMFACVGT
jgi:hypothetical protein